MDTDEKTSDRLEENLLNPSYLMLLCLELDEAFNKQSFERCL